MRTRTTGQIVSLSSAAKTTYCNGSSSSISYTSPLLKKGYMKSIQDVVVKDFKRQSSQGRIFNNPMVIIEESYMNNPGFQIATFTPVCSGSTIKEDAWQNYLAKLKPGVGPDLLQLDGGLVSSLITEAYTRAVANAGSPSVEGLVNIAELPRLLTDLRGVASSLEMFYRRAQREWYSHEAKRRIPQGVGATFVRDAYTSLHQWIASNWLRYRYSLLPIWQDAIKAFAQYEGPPAPERETFRAFKGANDSSTTTTRYTGNHFFADFNMQQTVNLQVRAGVLRQSFPGHVLDPYGISLAAVDDVIWELIPYSFIVDWFANVGEYLATLSPVVGYSGLASWHTLEYTYETSWDVDYTPRNVSGFSYSYSKSSGVRTRTEKVRIPGGPVDLIFRPFRTDPVWQKRIADLVAIFAAIISGKTPVRR